MKQSPHTNRPTPKPGLYPNALRLRQRMQRLGSGILCALSTLGVTGILFILMGRC